MRQKSHREKITPEIGILCGEEPLSAKDSLYDLDTSEPGDFVFDDRVVKVFPDMINRSVPGYSLIVPMIGILARRYAQPGSNLYDLGCSLGAVSMVMSEAVDAKDTRIFAIDNSAAMVDGLKDLLTERGGQCRAPILPVCQDVLDVHVENAAVVALNFTLQFIDPSERAGLLAGIAAGMRPGGILVLSEKIRFDDPAEQALQTLWHHDFKKARGYSELEIARKRDALENVMKTESLQQHRDRLLAAGFGQVYRWYQGFNFVSLAAFI